ncbi:MAG: hypothetical protein L0L20_10555 [Lactococcus lactis]|jgi:hypothetical protein|uniref:Uncharacterized protein n=1 Tax=Lactococcus lactis subsp. lactis TaxID=1360 RepID=A0A1V0P3B2_LACLL|nr:hypothetical protein [Lactococcus lactis]MDN6024121.1 hypothetical protein [Lactobacillus sp.]MDN6256066.1 hypothetical protein [Tetragenococcus koreensis]ARE21263.1 hypothetical protein LLUC06_1720 [Lactococcus lactis subsp. lactis]MDH8063914.1 hypothetical protein [Lactococcus lactis subsp. lactis]MDN5616567.1 hypothetical protein [Lactococcus lactis]
MKLSEIEAAGEITTIYDNDNYKWTGIIADRTLANYGSASDYQDKRALDFEKSRKVYTAEQMQEYAKECVREALNILDNTILPIFEDDKRVVMQKIFEEDTKND